MFPEDEVLRRIVPSPGETERMRETAGKLMRITADYMKAEGVDAEIRLAGSFSKGTFLSDPDLDLFIMFPEDFPRGELERIGLKAGDDILHGERMFSDHPYTRGAFGGMDVDMVPCYRLGSTDKLKSAVDRTPFHTSYILSRLSPEQKDQVRLLKKFMKGIGAYGAEQDSRGFSGYLCEILVVKYGSFRGVLSASRSWRKGTAVVIEEEGPRFDSPLTVYDPVDPRRNVASAVHEDTLALFITAAAAYLSDPGMKFFFPE